jgi:hypothetical protein
LLIIIRLSLTLPSRFFGFVPGYDIFIVDDIGVIEGVKIDGEEVRLFRVLR